MADDEFVADKVDDSALDPARLEAIKTRQNNVNSLMGRRAYGEALKASCENPPLASKNADVKVPLLMCYMCRIYIFSRFLCLALCRNSCTCLCIKSLWCMYLTLCSKLYNSC